MQLNLSQQAVYPLCSRSKEPSPFLCSHVGCCGSESAENPLGLASSGASAAAAASEGASTEAAGSAGSKAQGSRWVVVDFLIVGGFFCFPGVSVTSSNTGVPDISGSVYNKTQVSSAGPSSPSWPEADGPTCSPAHGPTGVESPPLSHRSAVSAPCGSCWHRHSTLHCPCVQMNAMALMFLVQIAPRADESGGCSLFTRHQSVVLTPNT